MSPWGNFVVVVCAQFLVFLLLAYKKRAAQKITPRLVVINSAVGLVFGIALDLFAGKYLGNFSYALHFDPVFLIINGLLSYGLWILTLQLLRQNTFLSFYAWTVSVGFVYEVANYFYPVWSWTFGGGFWYQESIVVIVVYSGGAMLIAFTESLTTRAKFHAFKLISGNHKSDF
jgi:hypothetical protein